MLVLMCFLRLKEPGHRSKDPCKRLCLRGPSCAKTMKEHIELIGRALRRFAMPFREEWPSPDEPI